MSLDPPKVMLERSFLDAIADTEHPRHDECVDSYRRLLEQFERQEVLLVAVGTHLRDVGIGESPPGGARAKWFVHRVHRGLFAPVEPLYVGWQHRRTAARTKVDDDVVAITLVMCERHRVRRIASINEAFEEYELTHEHGVPQG